MKTLAIIPAGGSGTRMGGGVPKQYLPLAGVPVLARTLQVFQNAPCIDAVFLAVPEGDVAEVQSGILEPYGLTKVARVVPGGRERQASVRNALSQAGPEWGIIVVHDGVRPFVTTSLIDRVVAAAREHGAVTVGIPVKDTIKAVGADGWVERTLDRQRLWLTQTPQAFTRSLLVEAYDRAEAEGRSATDDAGLLEQLGIPVRMLPGAAANIKLTTQEDLALGAHFLAEGSGSAVAAGNRP